MDLSTNIIRNVYNIGTNSCDAGTQYCTNEYTLYFPCLKDVTRGQNVCFDFYIADGTNKDTVDLRTVDAISLNLNGQFNCSYGTFSYPDNISSLQTEKYPVVYRDDFGKRKLCHFSLFMLDIENTGSETYYSTQESDFYSGTEVRVAAYDTPTHIFIGWAELNLEDEECLEENWYDDIISTSNTYSFIIEKDTILLALYRPRKKYNIVSDPENMSSYFSVDYNQTIHYISNRPDEMFNDAENILEDVLEGYHMVVKCIPSSDVIGNGANISYRFVEWKDHNTNRCRLFKIGEDTTPFEDEDTIKFKAFCEGPVPFYEPVDENIPYIDEFDEDGIHILNIEEETSDYEVIYDYYCDDHIKSADEVYQKFTGEIGYLYLHSGNLTLSSEGIEDGIKINIYAKADDYCELNIKCNGYGINQSISTEEFKLYEFYFSDCDSSDIEITAYGDCFIDEIEICKEEIIDKGKAQFCLDAETTSHIPPGPLFVNGAIAVGELGVDENGELVVENPQSYGLATTSIGQINKLPKININIE